jgi:hypothetical protein
VFVYVAMTAGDHPPYDDANVFMTLSTLKQCTLSNYTLIALQMFSLKKSYILTRFEPGLSLPQADVMTTAPRYLGTTQE